MYFIDMSFQIRVLLFDRTIVTGMAQLRAYNAHANFLQSIDPVAHSTQTSCPQNKDQLSTEQRPIAHRSQTSSLQSIDPLPTEQILITKRAQTNLHTKHNPIVCRACCFPTEHRQICQQSTDQFANRAKANCIQNKGQLLTEHRLIAYRAQNCFAYRAKTNLLTEHILNECRAQANCLQTKEQFSYRAQTHHVLNVDLSHTEYRPVAYREQKYCIHSIDLLLTE